MPYRNHGLNYHLPFYVKIVFSHNFATFLISLASMSTLIFAFSTIFHYIICFFPNKNLELQKRKKIVNTHRK